MWGKVSRLRKQHDGRDWVSNHRPSDLKFNALTTTPPRPDDGRSSYSLGETQRLTLHKPVSFTLFEIFRDGKRSSQGFLLLPLL